LASLCTGAYRLSKRTTQRLLDDFFNLSLSVGTISNLEAATTQALTAPVEEARAYIQEQSSAHLDETGWREGAKRAWLWVARFSFTLRRRVSRLRPALKCQRIHGRELPDHTRFCFCVSQDSARTVRFAQQNLIN